MICPKSHSLEGAQLPGTLAPEALSIPTTPLEENKIRTCGIESRVEDLSSIQG